MKITINSPDGTTACEGFSFIDTEGRSRMVEKLEVTLSGDADSSVFSATAKARCYKIGHKPGDIARDELEYTGTLKSLSLEFYGDTDNT